MIEKVDVSLFLPFCKRNNVEEEHCQNLYKLYCVKFKVKDMPQFFELSEHWTLMFLLKHLYTRTKTNRRCNTGQLQYHWQIQNEVAPFVILKTCEANENQVSLSFFFFGCYLQILYVKYSQNYSKGGFIPLKKEGSTGFVPWPPTGPWRPGPTERPKTVPDSRPLLTNPGFITKCDQKCLRILQGKLFNGF